MHGPTRHAEAPYTFFLPHPWIIGAVRAGDWVKLGFEYEPAGEKYGGERMWVEVDEVKADGFAGRLISTPEEPVIATGAQVEFATEHILDVFLIDQSRLPEKHEDEARRAQVPEERQYWDRCLVDKCVLYDGASIEYLYREEPDMSAQDDKHPDSGWRIRGRQDDASDADMDVREAAFVALGAVLNKDDSWLHLIDAPVGSAFTRNFESNSYEAVD